MNVRTSRRASSTDPASWTTFEDSLAVYQAGHVDGVGIVLGALEDGTNLVGIDLDCCRDRSLGELSATADEIITELQTYGEVSPTATGIKLLLLGQLPEGATRRKTRDGNVEIYTGGRYFCVTGWLVDGCPPNVAHRQRELERVYDRYLATSSGNVTVMAATNGVMEHRSESSNGHAAEAALAAMLRIRPRDGENDGSHRLLSICCRAVEHSLSDGEALSAIRRYAARHPFPVDWPDDQILQRLRDAENRPDVVRGSALERLAEIEEASRGRPQINAANKDLAAVTPLAWAALEQTNQHVIHDIFRRCGRGRRADGQASSCE